MYSTFHTHKSLGSATLIALDLNRDREMADSIEIQYRQLVSQAGTQRLHSPSLERTSPGINDEHLGWEINERRDSREKAKLKLKSLGFSWGMCCKYKESLKNLSLFNQRNLYKILVTLISKFTSSHQHDTKSRPLSQCMQMWKLWRTRDSVLNQQRTTIYCMEMKNG